MRPIAKEAPNNKEFSQQTRGGVMKRKGTSAAVRAALVTQVLCVGVVAHAQEGGLEEIVVTATRRETNLQDVPISIMALTGEQLEVRGLQSMENLTATIPNLNIIGGLAGSTTTAFSVRGIPNVGVYIDGIWQVGNAGLLTRNLVELERVEVLRGPQGTLYGRDSTGGSIRLVTKRPAEEFGAQISATVGSYNRTDVNLSVDVPLGENLFSKWTLASLERDGYIHGRFVNEDFGRIDDKVARGDIYWTPTERSSYRFNYQSNESRPTEARIQDAVFPQVAQQIGFAAGIVQFYTLAGAPITPQTQSAGYPGGQVGKWETNSEITLPDLVDDEQIAVDANWELTDSLRLQFLAGSTKQLVKNYVDWDNTQYVVFNDYFLNELDLFSQEIQISGGGDRIDWVAGVYHWDQENVSRNPSYGVEEFTSGQLSQATALASQQCTTSTAPVPCFLTVPIIASNIADDFNWAQQDGWAIFGEVVIGLTEKLDLTLGYRHHDQTNESSALAMIPGVTAVKPPSSNMDFVGGDAFAGRLTGPLDVASFDKGTSRVALNYKFSEDVSGYFGYSEGFNSGGIGVANFPAPTGRLALPYDPQTLDNYELGLRSDWFDGRVRFNATLFFMNFDDIQLNGQAIDPATGIAATTLVLSNVASAEAKGVEVELTYAPVPSLLINANLGLLRTEYTEVAPTTTQVRLGDDFAQAPETNVNLSLQHTADLDSGGTLTTRIDYTYTDQFWRSQIPSFRTSFYNLPGQFDEAGDYGLVNARLAYAPAGGAWELALFGTNLTDEYYVNSGFFHALWSIDFATVGRPREVGLALKVMFD